MEGTSSISQTELLLTRPSPAALYSALQEVGLVLTDNWHQPINFQPYGHNTQVVSYLLDAYGVGGGYFAVVAHYV